MDATAWSDTAINVTWKRSSGTDGIDVFYAYTEGTDNQFCEPDTNYETCTIEGLTAFTPYKICVRACNIITTTTTQPTNTDTANPTVGLEASTSNGNTINRNDLFCSKPTCKENVLTRPSGKFLTY